MKRFINWLKGSSSDFVLFLVVLVFANLASHNAYLRLDLTEPKSYSISAASKSLVKNLQEPLSVRVFFDKKLPAPYNSVSQYVQDFLSEYQAVANRNFSVSYMDVSKEENLQLAREFGLRQVHIQEVNTNEVGVKQVYMGLVLSYGDDVQTIDPVTTADGFEYKLTTAISKMINTADSLAGLGSDDKISVTVYLSNALKSLGISYVDRVESIVQEAFNTVNAQKKGRLSFKLVNPGAEECDALMDRYGIQGISYQTADGGRDTGVLGVVIESGDTFRVLPVEVQQSLFGYAVAGLDIVEESLNESIQSLISKPTQIGYVTGHNEKSLTDTQQSADFNTLVSERYEFVELDLNEADIPAGMTSIVINGPELDFTEEELYKVDQFLMRGGNILFFVGGFASESPSNPYMQTQYVKNDLNLDRLLEKWGVVRGKNLVFDKSCYETNNAQYGKLSMYWAPVLQKNQLAKNHPVTSNLGYVVTLENSSLDVSKALADKNVRTTILTRSSKDSWLQESTDVILSPLAVTPPSSSVPMESEVLSVLVEGSFESAFDEPLQTQAEGEISTINHLSKSKLSGKISVFGSSQVTTYQLIDSNGAAPSSILMQNLVDYMNGNEDLCLMRTKGLSVNTLTLKNQALSRVFQYFNEYGLAVLVALAGLFVWRARSKRKARINKKYNPGDTRTITRKSEKSEE